jgi:C4-dicarboxylate-specific signal transduction histidine kinase
VRRIANGVEPGELLNAMKQVTNQAQRAGEIIKRLRAFVSKGEPQRNIVQVNAMVREVLSMAKIDMRKHEATVRLRLTEQLPEVNVDMIQVEQVLLNLVRNGMEAMANTDPEERELVIRTFVNDDEKVELCVSDAGEGLPDSNQPDKVFDAFFTTKKEGMGMGLAISRSIIEAHGGRLWATSNPDRGTTFHFTLPVQHGGDDHGD